MTCAMKHEAWTWYPPSHLVVAKILCSRYKPCTNNWLSFFFKCLPSKVHMWKQATSKSKQICDLFDLFYPFIFCYKLNDQLFAYENIFSFSFKPIGPNGSALA